MRNKHYKKIIRTIMWVLFLIYIIIMIYFLFFSERYGRTDIHQQYRYNLVLFQEIRRFIQYREIIGMESFVINILGNIFAFAPFGFFLPMLSIRNKHWLNILFISFELTLTIELVQLFFKIGIFDVDDLLLNTLGGMIGYCFYYFSTKLVRKLILLYRRRNQNGGKKEEKTSI